MANWEKLDSEFYEVVNNLTDEQWALWQAQQHDNQVLRKLQKELEMQIQLLRLSFQSFEGRELFYEKKMDEVVFLENNTFTYANNNHKVTKNDDFSLAA